MENTFIAVKALGVLVVLFVCLNAWADTPQPPAKPDSNEKTEPAPKHGLVGLRPLCRNDADLKGSHGGPWAGLPTYDQQKGNYPFVAENMDVVTDYKGDFKTRRGFFEYYWGIDSKGDSLNPEESPLVKHIHGWEADGGEIEHILMCREYDLAIHRGYKNATPGPFKEDTRILFAEDVDKVRKLFKDAHEKGLLKHDNYKLIQMVQEPSFFAIDKRVHPIIAKFEGVALEVHQFNRHWPLETGWVKPAKVVAGAKWTIEQKKEYIFYFGPIMWKEKRYAPFIEREWMNKYWDAGLPKHDPLVHYYLNTFPNESGRFRPVGPESDPNSTLGFAKWMVEEIKGMPHPKEEKPAAK